MTAHTRLVECATVVTATEKAYKGSTLDATPIARATYNLLGGVASVEVGRATTFEYATITGGRRTSRSDPDGKAFWTYDPANGKGMLRKRCQGAATLTGCSASPWHTGLCGGI